MYKVTGKWISKAVQESNAIHKYASTLSSALAWQQQKRKFVRDLQYINLQIGHLIITISICTGYNIHK